MPRFAASWLEKYDRATYPILLLLGNNEEGKIKEAFFIQKDGNYQRIGVRQGSVSVTILTFICQP